MLYFIYLIRFLTHIPTSVGGEKTSENQGCRGNDQPNSAPPPFCPSAQEATAALADPGPIPVALPEMIDMNKAHTYLATNVAHTPYHQDHLTVPRLVLWQSCHWLQALLILGDSSGTQRFETVAPDLCSPTNSGLCYTALTLLLPLLFSQGVDF